MFNYGGDNRKPGGEENDQHQGECDCFAFVAADGRAKHSKRQRKQKVIDRDQDHPPELGATHPADQQRNRENRKNCQHAVKGVQRGGSQLSQDDVVPLQVGQKKQAECPFTFLFAQTIGCAQDAHEQAVKVHQNRHGYEQRHAEHAGCVSKIGECHDPTANTQGNKGRDQPDPMRARQPGGHSQFPFDYRQKGHRISAL